MGALPKETFKKAITEILFPSPDDIVDTIEVNE